LLLTVTVQLPVPLQAPDHPTKLEPAAGLALSVTFVPVAKLALHVVPQLIPAGVLVTVPVPLPDSVTVNVSLLATDAAKVAVAERLPLTVTVQVPVPLHAPDHPVNVELAAGVAVRVTLVPSLKLALQVVPQLMPDGLLVTVPVPVPANVTDSDEVPKLKVADTEVSAVIVTVQDPVPLHAPPQPVNTESVFGTAVKVTFVFSLKLALQVVPQLIPAGVLVIVPAPVPELVTPRVKDPGPVGVGDDVKPAHPVRTAIRPTRQAPPRIDLGNNIDPTPPQLKRARN
jgi:hypothetical protein